MEKMTKRKLQAITSRKNILDTAHQLTIEKGFDQISIQEICKTAGVSTGAFYHYFKSKDEIILAWYESIDEFYRTDVIPKIQEKTNLTAIEKICLYLREMAEQAEHFGVTFIRQLYRAQLGVGNTAFLYMERVLPDGLRDLIMEGQKAGTIITDCSAEVIKEELLVIMRGTILRWCMCNGGFGLAEEAENMMKRYLNAVAAVKKS